MDLDVQAINELVKKEYDGNKTRFAEELDISRPYISQILNGRSEPGGKFISSFYSYCNQRRLDFDSFIF